MTTQCNRQKFLFQACGRRKVEARFDGGTMTSDGGGLLLREVERNTRIVAQFAECFTDFRDPDLIEHTVQELVAQRVYGLALGYEDLIDHDELRADPMLAVLVGKTDPRGENRRRRRDRGKPLSGKSTLNRLELTSNQVASDERYKKIRIDPEAVDRFFIDACGAVKPLSATCASDAAVTLRSHSFERFTATRSSLACP